MIGRRNSSVIHVLWSGLVGGIERLVVDLATAQLAAGADSQIAFGTATGPFLDIAAGRSVPIHDLGFRSGFDVRPGPIRRATRILRGADVVHLHAFNAPLALAATRSRRPVVYTEHGFTEPSAADIAARIKRHERWRFLRTRATTIAANSAFTARRLAAAGSLPLPSIHVVHNGFDTDTHPRTSPRRRQGMRIVTVSRLVASKRVHLTLEALAETRLVTIDAIVVGDGPARASLETRAALLGVASRVEFVGLRDDVDTLLASADVLVHPAADEGFGMAVVEGVAQGLLPIVFSDAGGVLEVLPPDGEVVDNVAALAELLDGLVASDRLRADARNGRAAWVREAFPIERTAAAYGRLYTLASGPTGARGDARRLLRRPRA